MEQPFFNPDSWMDIVGLLIITIPGIVAAAATVIHNRRLTQIKDQVKNDHTGNLRDDLTQVVETISSVDNRVGMLHEIMFGLRQDSNFIRHEVRDVRNDLSALEQRVNRLPRCKNYLHDD